LSENVHNKEQKVKKKKRKKERKKKKKADLCSYIFPLGKNWGSGKILLMAK